MEIPERQVDEMNARQAARAAAERIKELESTGARAAADIKDYNSCILSMISGGSPCDWCEDQEECQLQEKGKGCQEWWLRFRKEEPATEAET